MNVDERFWSKVAKTTDDEECWTWHGTIAKNGYGRFFVATINGHNIIVPAHRYAYTSSAKTIPEGCVLHHKCSNRSCVNPSHLLPISHKEHTRLHNLGKRVFRDVHTARHLPQWVIGGTAVNYSAAGRMIGITRERVRQLVSIGKLSTKLVPRCKKPYILISEIERYKDMQSKV